MTLSAGTRLGPYEILSPLGAGGMGEVYKAKDSKLKRDVAIKVLPQSLAADPDALARFEREALAVAALSHQNILAIHDFGSQDGIAYAVMELLEGETLGARIAAGPISQKQAVDYALQVARGLSAAHQKGVVHRDLKPDNLFVTKEGHLKILDFGLAKRVEPVAAGEETSAPTASGHTVPGTVMGTVGYMSPEQVRAQAVDHRSDIFSFGTILYELLSGKKAFKRGTAADTMSAILREEPPELTESGRNISPALDHIVKHCLEKDRDNRFQTAKDIAFSLSEQSSQTSPAVTNGAQPAAAPTGSKRVLIAAMVLVVLAAVDVLLLRRPHRGGGEAGGVKRVAVLPFENLGAPEDDYFADGIADEIRSKLTSVRGVEVIARNSSTPYKKTTKTPRQIAKELDVGYLLTATVRWQKGTGASRVHVTPELVEVKESGAPASKWQQPFDAALTDVFQVQSDIATKVALALGVAIGSRDEKRLSEKPTHNLAAYDLFLKGEETEKPGAWTREAVGFFEQAVALDPGFAQAWAMVSRGLSNLSETPADMERARQAAEKAVALAPDQPDGYQALGLHYSVVGDFRRSLEECERGLRLAPANADLLRVTAVVEERMGRWEAALEHYRQAERFDPDWNNRAFLGSALINLRRYAEAREVLERGLALAPANQDLIVRKVLTFLGEGDLAGARAVLKALPKEVSPADLVADFADLAWVLDKEQRELLLRLTPDAVGVDRGNWGLSLAQAYALRGDAANVRTHAEEARKAYGEQRPTAPRDVALLHSNLGVTLAYLGRKEEAAREGEHAASLLPVTKDAVSGPIIQHELVYIYLLVGEQEKALDHLEALLKIPYLLSPGWLKIDPTFDPLRKNPRFQQLVASAK